jgi:peptide deformylase
MTIRHVITYPHPTLRLNAAPVARFDKSLHVLLSDMHETMYHHNGIGLAANQVDIPQQILVLDVSEERTTPINFINPTIVKYEGKTTSSEGCLSIPDYRESIPRYRTVTVSAQNKFGEEFTVDAHDLLAICLQHEIDHLNGVLFIDHLSFLKQQLFQKWCKKNLPEPVSTLKGQKS